VGVIVCIFTVDVILPSGANIAVGKDAPIRALIEAIGVAGCTVINAEFKNVVALPSLCLTRSGGSKSTLVIGADDDVADALRAAGNLHGAYHNVISPLGVSAMWNGVIGSTQSSNAGSDVLPAIEVAGKCASVVNPDNMAHPVDHVVFFQKGSAKSTIASEEAVKRILDICDASKEEAVKAFLSGVKVEVVGSADELLSLK
jgi:hypothetical protein